MKATVSKKATEFKAKPKAKDGESKHVLQRIRERKLTMKL